jgi:hypothetical protein
MEDIVPRGSTPDFRVQECFHTEKIVCVCVCVCVSGVLCVIIKLINFNYMMQISLEKL